MADEEIKKPGTTIYVLIHYRELLRIKEETLPADHPEILFLKAKIEPIANFFDNIF